MRHPARETSNPWVFPANSPMRLTPKSLGPAPLTPNTGPMRFALVLLVACSVPNPPATGTPSPDAGHHGDPGDVQWVEDGSYSLEWTRTEPPAFSGDGTVRGQKVNESPGKASGQCGGARQWPVVPVGSDPRRVKHLARIGHTGGRCGLDTTGSEGRLSVGGFVAFGGVVPRMDSSPMLRKPDVDQSNPDRVFTVEEYDRDPASVYECAGEVGRVVVVDAHETVMVIDRRPLDDDE